jgi:hypothetical protein
MNGRFWRAAAGLAGAGMLAAGLVLAAALPAAAVQVQGHICTANGQHMCITTNSFSYGTNAISDAVGGRTTCAPEAGTTGVLQLCGVNAPSNRCLSPNPSGNSLNLIITACSGVIGDQWTTIDNGDGTRSLVSVHWGGYEAAGDNVAGDIWIRTTVPHPGWYYRLQPVNT